MKNLKRLMLMAVAAWTLTTAGAQSVRECVRLTNGWHFALGNAAD